MWTPRRVLLLLSGILLFGGVYGFYARTLGWMDGLPQVPGKWLVHSDKEARIPTVRTTSPTIERIREAFGPDCLEQNRSHYPTQLEFRSSDNTSTLLACGTPPFNNNSNRIALTPFSVATIGAPKPAHLRQPGESPEINTFHADKAILEFDRPVNGPADMAKAKLLRMELVSEPPDLTRLKLDRRSGTIHITNNQRSTDPAKFLVVKTVGPVFYRDPKNVDPRQVSGGPDIWTDAAIEIVDRQNLPRKEKPGRDVYRTFASATITETAPAQASELQKPAAVLDVLTGQRPPPPTATAIGLKVFLDPPNKANPKPKKPGAIGGVRRVELLEKVVLHLWIDSKQGLMGSTGGKGPAASARHSPDSAAAALGGIYHGVEFLRGLDRALLQIDTLGRLAYETERFTARFDVMPDGNPDLPNDVQVHRVPPLGTGTQRLFSQILELEFNGSPVGAAPNKPPTGPSEGVGFKQLRAWAELPGRFVTITSESDRLEAYGQYLQHDKASETTSLRGKPLFVSRANEPRADGKRAGDNVITAGTRERPAVLTLKPGPAPDRAMTAAVDGPGRLEIFDPGSGGNTIHATWLTRMSVTKELVNRRPLDLFTFIDGAMFEDQKSDFWLKGHELRLWMESKDEAPDRPSTGRGKMMPHRVQALGEVASRSADVEVERAESLNVYFRDGIPPLAPAPKLEPKGPVVKAAPSAPRALSPMAPPQPEEPAKSKPPMKLKARTVDTWMVRYPLPAVTGTAPMANPAGESMKYELDKARCEGSVEVHQDPTEPGPEKRGLDVRGNTLLVDATPEGSVLTVTGLNDSSPGQVQHDGMSILGPKIVLDQLHNTADVEGRGSLMLPSSTNLGGGELKQASVVIIHWRDFMRFKGADRWTEFQGKVTAQQNDSSVNCHIMQVRLDKPVDFSRRKPATPKVKDGGPKIESVRCYPAPEDQRDEAKDAYWVTYQETARDETGRPVKQQRLTARELEMTARAFEPGTREPHQRVVASGPGTLRLLQSGLKDEAMPASAPAAKPVPGAKPTTAKESELKLTIVYFGGRMIARDFGTLYQDATFSDTIDLMHLPADQIDFSPDRHRLPPGSVRLTCSERLIVSSQKKPGAQTLQRLQGIGNAYIRSDEYDGWGESVTSEGATVTLRGGENTLARITNRFNNNRNTGRLLIYNRITGKFEGTESAGGTIEPGGNR